MSIHYGRNDFNSIVLTPPPPDLFTKPARYGVLLRRPSNYTSEYFQRQAVRVIWTKLNPANYHSGIGQWHAIKQVRALAREGQIMTNIYADKDLAETKVAEICDQERCYNFRLYPQAVRVLG